MERPDSGEPIDVELWRDWPFLMRGKKIRLCEIPRLAAVI